MAHKSSSGPFILGSDNDSFIKTHYQISNTYVRVVRRKEKEKSLVFQIPRN